MKLSSRRFVLYLLLILVTPQCTICFQGDSPSENNDYQEWKKEIQKDWINRNQNLVKRLFSLTSYIKHGIPKEGLEVKERPWATAKLYSYNFARELLHEPPASSLEDIDKKWIDDLEETIEPYKVAEDVGLSAPLLGMKELLHEAQTILDVKKKLVVVTHSHERAGESGSHYVALCQTPDLDLTLAILYHELGHIVNNDNELSICLNEIDPSCRTHANIPTVKDVAPLKEYLSLGLKHISNESEVGKKVLKVLDKLKKQGMTIYQFIDKKTPPTNPPVTDDTIINRNIERRADLFALNTLYRLGKIDPILSLIENFSNPPEPVAFDDIVIPQNGKFTYPSNLERVLYAAGFLFDKGLDANALLKHYESEGVCLSREELEKSPASSTRAAFEKLYAQWREQKFEDYKKRQLSEYEAQQTEFGDRVIHLIETVRQSIHELSNAPLYYQMHALYAYNLLREFFKMPHAKAMYDIDNKWLSDQEQKYKKGIFHNVYNKLIQIFSK